MYKLIHELSYHPMFCFFVGFVVGVLLGLALALARLRKLPKFTFGQACGVLGVLTVTLAVLITVMAIQMPFFNHFTELYSHEVLFGKAHRMDRYSVYSITENDVEQGAGTYYLACQPGCFEEVYIDGVDGVSWRLIPDTITNTGYTGTNGFVLFEIPVDQIPADVVCNYGDHRKTFHIK